MKRFFFALVLVSMGMGAIAPMAVASQRPPNRQVSSPSELGEGATILDVIRHNRDIRSRKK